MLIFSETLTEYLDLREEPYPEDATHAEVQRERTERNKRMAFLLEALDNMVHPEIVDPAE